MDSNFNLDKSDGEAGTLQRQAVTGKGAGGGERGAGGKAQVDGAVRWRQGAGTRGRLASARRTLKSLLWELGGGKAQVVEGTWLRRRAWIKNVLARGIKKWL
jgi:hypothetical protein